jgi:WXXGXW repeat (2 copies)
MKTYALLPAILLAIGVAAVPQASQAQFDPCVSAAVSVPPPALPEYQQPLAPGPNYMWNPGYWAWNSYGYYWVPGVWVVPPAVGLYWTPGYWGYAPAGYVWNQGYWGPSVGFYGGINYGFGYFGIGFVGGFWAGGAFNYNTAVTNVNRTVIKNVYSNGTVIDNHFVRRDRVSFNGGHGGISARPTHGQVVAARERRFSSTPVQTRHAAMAGVNRNNFVAFNHGKPPVTAVQKTSGTIHGQPGFKGLTTHDQNVARGQAMSRVRVANAPVAHAQVATRGTSSAAASRERAGRQATIGAPGSHGSQGGFHGSQGGFRGSQGGFHGPQGGFHDSQGGFHDSQGGFHGPQGGFHGGSSGQDSGAGLGGHPPHGHP